MRSEPLGIQPLRSGPLHRPETGLPSKTRNQTPGEAGDPQSPKRKARAARHPRVPKNMVSTRNKSGWNTPVPTTCCVKDLQQASQQAILGSMLGLGYRQACQIVLILAFVWVITGKNKQDLKFSDIFLPIRMTRQIKHICLWFSR